MLNIKDTIMQARISLNSYVEVSEKLEKEQEDEKLDKPLHRQFVRQTNDLNNKDRWLWLTDGYLKRETESLIIPTTLKL